MSPPVAKLYLDEDVAVLVAALLRSRGFEAETTQEAGNTSASDRRQLEYAAGKDRALLTHNRTDFEHLATQFFQEGRHHAGIIIAARRRPHDILRRLLALLNRTTAEDIADNVWYL